MRKIYAKMISIVLSPDKKHLWVELCEDWFTVDAESVILNQVVTDDKSWIYKYDPGNKRQKMEWKTWEEPSINKACMSKSNVKALLIALFNCLGSIMEERVLTGQTVNAIYYHTVMRKLHEWIRKKHTELWKNGFVIHYDHAQSHTAYTTARYFSAKNCSTDLSRYIILCSGTLFDQPCENRRWESTVNFKKLMGRGSISAKNWPSSPSRESMEKY